MGADGFSLSAPKIKDSFMQKKRGRNKAESISAVNEFFGEGAFEDAEDAPKPPRMKMIPYVYVPLLAPRKVDYCKEWDNTGKVLNTYFQKRPHSKQAERQPAATSDEDE
jgi:hypothetical protein